MFSAHSGRFRIRPIVASSCVLARPSRLHCSLLCSCVQVSMARTVPADFMDFFDPLIECCESLPPYPLLPRLTRYPRSGQGPLPSLNVLNVVLNTLVRQNRQEFNLAVLLLQTPPVPGCPHTTTSWFPPKGPVCMELAPTRFLVMHAPMFKLCSDCGVCVELPIISFML